MAGVFPTIGSAAQSFLPLVLAKNFAPVACGMDAMFASRIRDAYPAVRVGREPAGTSRGRWGFLARAATSTSGSQRPSFFHDGSPHELNGTTEVVIQNANSGIAELAASALEGRYDTQTSESGGLGSGTFTVKAHPIESIRFDNDLDRSVVDMLKAVLAASNPKASIVEARSFPHPALAVARASPLAKGVLEVLERYPIPVRWAVELGISGPKAILLTETEGGPAILVNPYIFLEASLNALATVLSHEAYHYMIYLKLRRLGIDWLSLGGIEFERLAKSAGARVWFELGSTADDDLAPANDPRSYTQEFASWVRESRRAYMDRLQVGSYRHILSLEDLLRQDPQAIADELGLDETGESVRFKLAKLMRFYRRELLRERLWMARHPLLMFWSR